MQLQVTDKLKLFQKGISYFGHACPKQEIRNFVSISRLTGKCAAEKLNNFSNTNLWTCLHHIVILRNQNKIPDFL